MVRRRTFAVLAAALMLVAVASPVVAAEESELDFEVTQDVDFEVTVTVTENGSPVEGANVTVDPVPPGRSYNGSGLHATNANGTVELPAPRDDLLVDVAVSHNDSSVSERLVLKANGSEENESDLLVEVTQHENYTSTVTVTENGSPVAGANVSVGPVPPHDAYVGSGGYVTDANGTLTLPVPETDVRVRVRARHNGSQNTTVATLEAPAGLAIDVAQDADYNVTIAVTDNGSAAAGANVTVTATAGNYTAEGEYVTDADGTVDLPAPTEEVQVEVTAEFDNRTATTLVSLRAANERGNRTAVETFGRTLERFIQSLGGVEGPRGLAIADFVLENNPGNPPDHAGPPAAHPLRGGDELDIRLSENNDTATVTVSANGSPAANATVDVSALSQGRNFSGDGTYSADANGRVTVGLPAKPTQVTITATHNNSSTAERFKLSGTETGPPEDAGPPVEQTESESETEGDDNGPPDDKGRAGDGAEGNGDEEGNDGNGPPDDKGSAGDGANGNGNSGNGPPDDKGNAGNGQSSGNGNDRCTDDNERNDRNC